MVPGRHPHQHQECSGCGLPDRRFPDSCAGRCRRRGRPVNCRRRRRTVIVHRQSGCPDRTHDIQRFGKRALSRHETGIRPSVRPGRKVASGLGKPGAMASARRQPPRLAVPVGSPSGTFRVSAAREGSSGCKEAEQGEDSGLHDYDEARGRNDTIREPDF